MDDIHRRLAYAAVMIALLLLISLFTAIERAILECSENRVRQLCEEKKDKRAAKLLTLKEDKRQEVRTTGLAVRMLFSAVLVLLAAKGYVPPLTALFEGLVTDAGISRILSYLCVLVPACLLITAAVSFSKRLAGYDMVDEHFALKTLGVFRSAMVILKPVCALSDILTNLLLHFSGVKDTEKDENVTEEEILMLVDAVNDSGDIDESQAEMITNIFEFDDLEAKDVMTHRIDITGIERNEPVSKAIELAINEGFSRIPVYDGDIDNICGVIFAKDLLKLSFESRDEGLCSGDVCREISFVPENIKCGELFESMTKSGSQLTALVDEYGGTAGIVTMEDLIEAIVGSIRDEFDENETEDIVKLSESSYDVSGTARPEEVMEAVGMGASVPEEFDTIGGFVIDLLGFIPSRTQKPTVKWNGLKFTVLRADETKIEKLRVKRLENSLVSG